ncbi:MAG: hypothetical protein V4555_04125 [Acidobacteriota bacterium]
MPTATTRAALTLATALLLAAPSPHPQAASIPSAQSDGDAGGQRGRKLLDQMVEALGGPLWLNRTNWSMEGQAASFYQGKPHEGVVHFLEIYRPKPFGERIVIITKIGVFFPTDHRDVAEVWTPTTGYEISFKGKKELLKNDIFEYQTRRAHSLETVVNDWLKQPNVLVTYEGTRMVERRLADQVSILTANDDAITLQLDASTHLPLSRSFQFRDPVFGDLDTDLEQYDDYHPIQGIQTPMTVTRLHNGEMVSQRFFTKVTYNEPLSPGIFDPDRPLSAKTK